MEHAPSRAGLAEMRLIPIFMATTSSSSPTKHDVDDDDDDFMYMIRPEFIAYNIIIIHYRYHLSSRGRRKAISMRLRFFLHFLLPWLPSSCKRWLESIFSTFQSTAVDGNAENKKWNANENEFISLATTNKLIILYFHFE